MVIIQYSSIGLINTQSRCEYNSPHRPRHVVTCSRQSVSCLQTVQIASLSFSQVQRVFVFGHCLAVAERGGLIQNLNNIVFGFLIST
jgi:hypothetical protein